jgi:hypothetical protein
MTDFIAESNKAADQYLAAVAQVQDQFVQAIEAFVKNLPELPKPAVELPAFDLPVDLPKAEDVTAATFDFAEKVLAQHRAATDKLVAVLAPAV